MNNKKQENKKSGLSGMQKFWLLVIFVYGTTFLTHSDWAWQGLKMTGGTLLKIIPLIFLILGMMVVVNLFLTPERVKKHIGQEAGWKGWFYAILFGVIVAGPPYALYPMLKQMKEHGMKTSYLAAFLYNRNVKIALMPAMIYYFGWQYTAVMTILVIIFSIISGVMMEKIAE